MKLLIVEPDAAYARFFRHLTEQQQGILEVGVTDSAPSALRYIGEKAPDLLVLEAQLGEGPHGSGLDLLRSIYPDATPAIVMSDCGHHALEAFRMGAVDFLRKPVTAGQFLKSLQRAQRLHASRRHEQTPFSTGDSSPAVSHAKGAPSRLIGERSNRYYFIEVDDIDFIEAYGNYVKIHVGAEQYLRRDTLRRLAAALSDSGFQLVKRSTLVNLNRVTFAEKCGEGALAFNLCSGARLVSRTRFKFNKSSFALGKT